MRANLLGPPEDARGCPLGVRAVAARHVLRHRRVAAVHEAARVRGDALAAVQDLDRRRCRAYPEVHVVVPQRVRRRVEVAVVRDVVVDVERDLLPRRDLEGLGRQRRQRGPVEPLEELAAARLVRPHRPVVEHAQKLGEPRVERAQARERLVADAREQPPLGDLHADLHLGLVARRPRARRKDRRLVVPRELRGRALDAGVVAARGDDGALELVGHDRARHAAEKCERARHASDEVGDLLRARRLRVRVVARAQHRDEQLDVGDLARHRVDEPRSHPGVVDEQLVAGDVHLPHHRRLPLLPLAVPIAEGRVAQTVRLRGEVLDVQQRQRHATPPQLEVQRRAVGLRPHARRRRRIHAGLELGVGQRVHRRRVEPVGPRVGERARDRARAHAHRPRHLAVAAAERKLLSQDLAEMQHRESFGRHATF